MANRYGGGPIGTIGIVVLLAWQNAASTERLLEHVLSLHLWMAELSIRQSAECVAAGVAERDG